MALLQLLHTTKQYKHKSTLEVCGRRARAEWMKKGGLRRSKRRREEERKEGRRGGEAGGRKDDSPLMLSPRRRQILNKTFTMLGGNIGGEG